MQRIPYSELFREFQRVLVQAGVAEERAAVVAGLFADNQRDGVQSHGLNRFSGFVADIRNNRIHVRAEPARVAGRGMVEQWDGNLGIGLWNARVCMGRAIELAEEGGIGCVALRNTNHWMRAGAYALQAAEARCVGICWTNTIPLMPPWGSAEVRIGNNPIAIAVPRRDGPMLLDMAMSQYSNGKLEVMRRQGAALSAPGGYDANGNLTKDPGAILASRRPLPIGRWKGSAMAVVLDAAAALLSEGRSSPQIGREGWEQAVSQVFIAINSAGMDDGVAAVDAIVADLHTAAALPGEGAVRYPGEGMLRIRRESLAEGVPVDDKLYRELRNM